MIDLMYCSFTAGVTSTGLPEIFSCMVNGVLGDLKSLAEDCNGWNDIFKGVVKESFKTLFFNLEDSPDDYPVGSRRGSWCVLKSLIPCRVLDCLA